ncbi:hypothetical protein EXIGLDRAFT_837092 [Exidia glandulosa HHB12029]|uniref:Fungal-type protein kinase domain-containing protein n=1 Tax=Exidia glandulosa HHB12029 TaxID=1314781 RepID=A0A165H6G7_EXIGL|nr:hypothetical protein EXIGLDRAFT_837092 [Exidia glandulosa HHB12029]
MSATPEPATDTAPDDLREKTPPRQPDAEKEAFSTPYGINHRPAMQNMYAKHVHWYNAEAMEPVVEATFFDGKPQKYGDLTEEMEEKMASDAGIKRGLKAVARFTKKDLENRRYAPTIKLLNRLSCLYFEISKRRPDQDAIVFTFAPTREAPGSFLGEAFQPDYLAYLASVAELRDAISAENGGLLPWSVLIGVGEHKRSTDKRLAQLKTYTSLLKRYRPDLPAIHGFHVTGKKVEIASLDSSVFRMSKACPVDTLKPWLALVASLYHSADTRYKPLTYNSSQLDFHRWDVEYENLKIATVPFHVGEAPGRTTFAALELEPGGATQNELTKAFYETPAHGFFKSSWQSATARWTESELLERIHKDGWLPGVVRHRFTRREIEVKDPAQTAPKAKRQPGAESAKTNEVEAMEETAKETEEEMALTEQTQEQTEQTEQTQEHTQEQTAQTQGQTAQTQAKTTPLRVREIINLGSIGEPLSEARTMRHLLWAFYDFIETSSQLGKLGIIHRDLSWFNCLILPRHTVAGEKRPLSRPCIRRILDAVNGKIDTTLEAIGKRQTEDADTTSAGAGTTVDAFMPCTLVADFDHSADIKQLQDKQQQLNIRERTGTNMFIACDLSKPGCVPYTNNSKPLLKALALVGLNRRGPAALAAAFPEHDDAGFLDMIKRVVAEESERQDQVTFEERAPPPVPKGLHEPRHDAESLFWVHLWGCARAQPLLSTVPDDDRSYFNEFCSTMLSHRIRGGNKEAGRARYLTPQALEKDLFHPRFHRVQILFAHMILYLTIPWHLYQDDPYIKEHPDHAHVAFRRLLLWMLLRDDMSELDDPLNTEEPRVAENLEKVLQFAVASDHRAVTGNESIPQSASKTVSVEKKPPAVNVSGVDLDRRGEPDLRAQYKSENAQVPLPKKKEKKKKEPKPSTPAVTPASTSTSQVSTRSQKRAREETHADDGAAKKMRPDVQHEQDVQPMAVDAPEREPVAEDQPQVDAMADEAKEDAPTVVDKTQRYIAEVHQPLQTVNALRLKIWKDKALWFGKGQFSPPPSEETGA